MASSKPLGGLGSSWASWAVHPRDLSVGSRGGSGTRFWDRFLEVGPGRLKFHMFGLFLFVFELMYGAFLGLLSSSLRLRRRERES